MMNTALLLVVGIIGFVFLILNVVFILILFFLRRRMATVSQWPSTIGTVSASYLERRRSRDSGSRNYPAVHYSYQVCGQAYQGMKIAPGPHVGGTGAGKVVERYPVGAQGMIFYNPQNPSDAVLETKAPAQWVLWLILVVFDCTLCGVFPILWWSMNQ
jgi:hypothetical protein